MISDLLNYDCVVEDEESARSLRNKCCILCFCCGIGSSIAGAYLCVISGPLPGVASCILSAFEVGNCPNLMNDAKLGQEQSSSTLVCCCFTIKQSSDAAPNDLSASLLR